MIQITLFEHQRITYADLGWGPDSIYPDLLERLNDASSDVIIHVGRKSIKAAQYVGILRVGDLSIQILPKIDFDPEGDAESLAGSMPRRRAENSAMHNLLHMLAYAEGIELREKAVAGLQAQRSDWFELLTRFFALELHSQFAQGVYRAYVRQEDSLPVMRGKWLLARQLSRRPHIGNNFELAFDEFTVDTRLNQVFRFVVERLLTLTNDPTNQRLLHAIRAWLIDVRLVGNLPAAALDEVPFDRLNDRFRVAFNYARMFLAGTSTILQSGRTQAFAFVFDMNRLFERFVARFILRFRDRISSSHKPQPRITVQSKGTLIHLLQRDIDGKEFVRLQPDLLFSQGDGRHQLIVDTKYKYLGDAPKALAVSEADLYQMLAYMVRFKCENSMLLYPGGGRDRRVSTRFRVADEDRVIHVASIDLRKPLSDPRLLIGELASLFEFMPSRVH